MEYWDIYKYIIFRCSVLSITKLWSNSGSRGSRKRDRKDKELSNKQNKRYCQKRMIFQIQYAISTVQYIRMHQQDKLRLKVFTNTGLNIICTANKSWQVQRLYAHITKLYKQVTEQQNQLEDQDEVEQRNKSNNNKSNTAKEKSRNKQLRITSIRKNTYYIPKSQIVGEIFVDNDQIECILEEKDIQKEKEKRNKNAKRNVDAGKGSEKKKEKKQVKKNKKEQKELQKEEYEKKSGKGEKQEDKQKKKDNNGQKQKKVRKNNKKQQKSAEDSRTIIQNPISILSIISKGKGKVQNQQKNDHKLTKLSQPEEQAEQGQNLEKKENKKRKKSTKNENKKQFAKLDDSMGDILKAFENNKIKKNLEMMKVQEPQPERQIQNGTPDYRPISEQHSSLQEIK